MQVEVKKVIEEELVKIRKAAQSKEPVELSFYSVTRNEENIINQVLQVYLDSLEQSHLFSYLSYSTLELVANANKANIKRIYFKDKKLDINNPEDYSNGMLTFNTETTVNYDHYKELLEAQNMFVHLVINVDENITVEVTNKAQLMDVELHRINEKLERAKVYNSMDEALTDIDKTEGSGLGLIIIVLMLKQLGLNRQNLTFDSVDGTVTFTITIPMNTIECI